MLAAIHIKVWRTGRFVPIEDRDPWRQTGPEAGTELFFIIKIPQVIYILSADSLRMRNYGQYPLFLILIIIFGFLLCSACTQKSGPSPLAGQTPELQNPPGPSDTGGPIQPGPGQPGPGMPGPGPAGGSCPPAEMQCGGQCIDPLHDRGNCGKCGNTCPPDQPCSNGQCGTGPAGIPGIPGTPSVPGVPGTPFTPGIPSTTATPGTAATTATSGTVSCSSGQTNCGGSCINTQTNSQHCGKCNNSCASGQSCSGAKCGNYVVTMTMGPQAVCTASGKLWCSGACVDQNTDTSNCGSCGGKCQSQETCEAGSCGMFWTGTWVDSSGYSWTMVQSGSTVTGQSSLTKCSGTTSGSPPKLTGTWSTTASSGSVVFAMAGDGKTFSAVFTQGGTGNKQTITGTRK
jgi:hypothetical protein